MTTTPVQETEQNDFPPAVPNNSRERRESDEDGTLFNDPDHPQLDRSDNNLKVITSYATGSHRSERSRPSMSPLGSPHNVQRLEDDLVILRAEQDASDASKSDENNEGRSRPREERSPAAIDDFELNTGVRSAKTNIYKPLSNPNPTTKFAKLLKRVHKSNVVVRYFCYIVPLAALLTIPVLFGRYLFPRANVGGIQLMWFGVWLEIIWCTLWVGRVIARCLPVPIGILCTLFSDNPKKYRDLGKTLEVPATFFFWCLAIEISFLPIARNHIIAGYTKDTEWQITMNKVLIGLLITSALNFAEKVLIQLLAIGFHSRTYADRIQVIEYQIDSLVKMYVYSKQKIGKDDSEFESHPATGPPSGTRTPKIYIEKTQKVARHALNTVGDVAGKMAGDFIGRNVANSKHPHQITLNLLHTTDSSQTLARRLFETFAMRDAEGNMSDRIVAEDLRLAFDNDEEAETAFAMFDKDLNGDISKQELESVCTEIGRERKHLTGALKDLATVVRKFDAILLITFLVIALIIFLNIISSSAQAVLTSLGSTVLALSWLLSATAQEFLQSLIFVFVKHPFDVGDRVTIYGNTGSQGKGDDYFVKEISLLYTEFKKMEGHVVQAPNSYLNTLFILNQRRSAGLAEAIPIVLKFGTTMDQLQELRERLEAFVKEEKREYQGNILTELTTVTEVYSITVNIVFFYKSNWQNELVRLQRRNKFVCFMMVAIQELGIEGPIRRTPGGSEEYPMYLHGNYPYGRGSNQGPEQDPSSDPRSGYLAREQPILPPLEEEYSGSENASAQPSTFRRRARTSSSRWRGESISELRKRVDFSLGAKSSGFEYAELFDDRKPRLPPPSVERASRESRDIRSRERESDADSLSHIGSRESNRLWQTSSNRSHLNRFLGSRRNRNRGQGSAEEGTDLQDLEAGTGGVGFSEMSDIPEASGGNSASTPTVRWDEQQQMEGGSTGRGRGAKGRIDPRSGMISPQAVVMDSDVDRIEFPSNVRRAATERIRRH